MLSKWFVQFLIFSALLGCRLEAQEASKNLQAEQTSFGIEAAPGEKLIDKPVSIPEEALRALKISDTLLGHCYGHRLTKPKSVLTSWFIGSEVHLAGPDEVDLIVMPRDMNVSPSPNVCLLGAHTAPFWVLRKRNGKYEMLFETDAEYLEILDSKTNGYRDIEEETYFISATVTNTNRFDGKKYRFFERRDTPVE